MYWGLTPVHLCNVRSHLLSDTTPAMIFTLIHNIIMKAEVSARYELMSAHGWCSVCNEVFSASVELLVPLPRQLLLTIPCSLVLCTDTT